MAAIVVGPAVIRTGEARGVAAVGAAQPVAAMTAHIQEGAGLAAGVAHYEDRVLAHVGGKEIAWMRDLAVMAEEQPAARENAALLLLIDLRLDKDAVVEEAAFGIDQPIHIEV